MSAFDWIAYLAQVPQAPGVYQMFNARGEVIYVGKASQLRQRLQSYARQNLSVKTEKLVSQIQQIHVTVTESSTEALLMEANLIKKWRPRYNILLRDDKSYPFIVVGTAHPFPFIDSHRGSKNTEHSYFGPYPSMGSVRETLSLLQKVFRLRQCSESVFRNRSRPCLQYEMQRCTAPCVGYVSQEHYQKQVQQALLFLSGKSQEVVQHFQQQMQEAAKQLDYEQAAIVRDQIQLLQTLQVQQFVTGETGHIDVLGFARENEQAVVSILSIRDGRVLGHHSHQLKLPQEISDAEIMATFITQYYLSTPMGGEQPERVLTQHPVEGAQTIEQAFLQQHKISFKIKMRLNRAERHWQTLIDRNAVFALQQQQQKTNQWTMQWQALEQVLQVGRSLQRIECFDVSHTMGELTVASCVVGEASGLNPSQYRRFNITGITPGDDYHAMYQALERHYQRVANRAGPWPDLIIVDGGLGQLRMAHELWKKNSFPTVILLGMAKGPERKAGEETIWLHGLEEPLHLTPASPALHVMQQIRDEAHRFAITAHRSRRAKVRVQSSLQAIPGIGPERRRKLLKHFKGLAAMQEASLEEIAKAGQMSQELAQRIKDWLIQR